jgi:hypothetical protein
MAERTIQIDGVGKVQVDESFLSLPPDQQDAQIQEIVKAAGHASSPSPTPRSSDPNDVFSSLVHHESHGEAGAVGPDTPYGNALGAAQTLPDTAREMANKLGLPWRPELLTAKSPEGLDYQLKLGRAYFNEGLAKYNGDLGKALMYYHGGPDERQWGPKTHAYANAILARSGRDTLPDTPGSPPQEASMEVPQDAPAPAPAERSPERLAEIKAANEEAARMAQSGASLADVQAMLSKHGLSIRQGEEKRFGPNANFAFNGEVTQAPSPDANPGHVAAVVARGGGQGLIDLLGTAGEGALNTFLPGGLGKTLGPQLTGLANQSYDALAGDFGKAKTALDKYLAAAAGGATSALAGGAGLEQGAANLIRMGVGGGVGSQAASDIFPNSDIAPILGAVVGGGAVSPQALEHVPSTRARFVRNVRNSPYGAHMVDVVRGMAKLAEDQAPKGAAPKGRAPLTVEQINAVGKEGFAGLNKMITAAPDIPTSLKTELQTALQRKADISPAELNRLGKSPEAEAVRQAIMRFQASRVLTPAYGGQNLGMLGKAWNKGLDLIPGPPPVLTNMLKLKGGDINKSRMDAAAKALKRLPLYEKAGEQISPSGYRQAMDNLAIKYGIQSDLKDQAKGAAAARQAQTQKVRQDNDLISRRVERNIERPSDGYRGLIYSQTGVTQPVQDQALLYMVKKGELMPEDLSRVMADPNSLMRGGSKAGLKIMDRINELADQGVIKRDAKWKGPPEKLPTGVLNWLDAQGNPIQSMGAYAGGIVKNVIRELRDEGMNLDDKLDTETVPGKPKTKKKKKQGA